ncbi:MAG: U32 family peptidase [Ruminococcaceae bacterium]|nr:U32 family peptidase [Oscillospiraceae bacterium]
MSKIIYKKPELLAPAGSMEALDAAISGGADAVYFGSSAFNARMNAQNFDRENIKRAIEKCRNYGVRSNITFNTLIYDREIKSALDEIEFLYNAGADALIIADLGLACEVRRIFPDIELHASTQMSVHDTEGAKALASLGFSRVVVARELDRETLYEICKNSPIETEMFIHGALCVSHSGQCLFSSLVGARSGNRGECAQPCRLPYSGAYPLSLKDNCLASCFEDVLALGAASLKIEGRMKSPEYVYGTTAIYRRLIDEKRNATFKEMKELAALFSRSGFTDGYFKNRINSSMLGVRTDADKALSVPKYDVDIKNQKRELSLFAKIKLGEPASLTLSLADGDNNISVTSYADAPERAIRTPLTEESVRKNILKFGATDFVCNRARIELDTGVIMPVSKINALRRDAVAAIEEALMPKRRQNDKKISEITGAGEYTPKKSARFLSNAQIPDAASGYFGIIYLPLEAYEQGAANGVILPPVIFDKEVSEIKIMLEKAKKEGAVHALVANIGHLSLAREYGFICHGDFRLNATNVYTVNKLLELGFEDIIPSPELTLAKIADLLPKASENTVVYGRIPMMLLEKCVIKDMSGCDKCSMGKGELVDRMGEKFPVYKTHKHRNTVYNSRVTYMADKRIELERANIYCGHYIFTDEGADDVKCVIDAYKEGKEPTGNIRRIARK